MITLILLGIVITLIYRYLTKHFDYWKKLGIPYLKGYPIFGSLWKCLTFQQNINYFLNRIYQDYQNVPFVGMFQGRTPTLLVRDPDLIKSILVKDFASFTDHGLTFSEDELIGKNLFNMSGHKWKGMRTKLAPTFTSGRMKEMFPLVFECSQILETYLETQAVNQNEIDAKDIMARYTTSVIANSVFGIKCDAINDPNHTFRVISKNMVDIDIKQGIIQAINAFLPGVAKVLGLSFFKAEWQNYFREIVTNILTVRQETGIVRKDFLQLLSDLKNKGHLEDDGDNTVTTPPSDNIDFTEEDILGQAVAFFFAGFETTSSALQFALYELSHNQEIQLKAREEIERVLSEHNGEINHQSLQEMKYLDWIFKEVGRKYPPISVLRECTKEFIFPKTRIKLEKGVLVIIPTYAIHHDPKYYENPYEFIPERWADEKMVKDNQYLFLTFGEGPRQCIGMRFAYLQTKLGLLSILRRFNVIKCKKTPDKITFDTFKFIVNSKEEIFVKITKA